MTHRTAEHQPKQSDFQFDPRNHPLWHRQVELEMEMLESGVERFRWMCREARANGKEATLPHVRRLLTQFIEPVAEEIRHFQQVSKRRKGVKHIALQYLSMLEPEVAAFLGLKVIMDGVSKQQLWVQSLANQIGRSLMAEVKLSLWANEHPEIWEAYQRRLDKDHATQDHRKKVLRHGFNKLIKEKSGWIDWPDNDILHLGMKAIELVVKGTKRFSMKQVTQGVKSWWVLEVSPETSEWLAKAMANQELLCPQYMPCVIPPKDWTSPKSGGYWTGVLRQQTLVRYSGMTRGMTQEAEGILKKADMGWVYKAVNALQNTGWGINTRVLEVAEHLWRVGNPVAGLPPRENIQLPEKPEDIETNEEGRKQWRMLAKEVHSTNSALTQKRLNVESLLVMARKFASEEAFYFPHTMDFRGRVYAMAHSGGLNPQGTDMAKGLLQFAEGVALTEPRHVAWLAVHVANCWGVTKVSLDDRIAWVYENEQQILQWAKAPLSDLGWTQADGGDGAWQFLAACMDWLGYTRHGLGYVSRLPVRVDGTCNGLQHLSALLRDSKGGKATNLIPAEVPQDIYREVADIVTRRLQQIAVGHDQRADLAKLWLKLTNGAVPRDLTKRSVMILPYGGTMLACRKYIEDWLNKADPRAEVITREETEGKKEGEKSNLRVQALTLITELVWSSIKEVVVAADVAFRWIKEAAKQAATSGKPLVWETPSGFPVFHFYADHPTKKVKINTEATTIQLHVPSPSNKLLTKDQLSGVAPNFVHSMDASAAHLFLCGCVDNGLTSVTTIHDSYGTHAARMDDLAAILREAFVGMYQEFDPMEDFRGACLKVAPIEAQIPGVPPKGDLRIEEVLGSSYFFH